MANRSLPPYLLKSQLKPDSTFERIYSPVTRTYFNKKVTFTDSVRYISKLCTVFRIIEFPSEASIYFVWIFTTLKSTHLQNIYELPVLHINFFSFLQIRVVFFHLPFQYFVLVRQMKETTTTGQTIFQSPFFVAIRFSSGNLFQGTKKLKANKS